MPTTYGRELNGFPLLEGATGSDIRGAVAPGRLALGTAAVTVRRVA